MKVRDHNHYTGKYRGAAHSICNLRYKIQKDIPVVTRDGRNNDFHLIITELAKEFRAEIVYLKIKKNTKHLVFQSSTEKSMV